MKILGTILASYQILRAEGNEDASPINLTTGGDFANKPAAAKSIKVAFSEIGVYANQPENEASLANAIQLVFCGGAAADKTFSYKVYGWRNSNGPAELVCSGTGTLGTQAVVKYPHSGAAATNKFWADTLTVSSKWLRAITQADAGGGNGVAKLMFDACGYEWFYVEITNADGVTGSEAGAVSVYWSWL